MSTVRENLLNQKGYTPYCGGASYKICRMPRTKFNGQQFECPECDWVSQFPEEFIKEYAEKWGIELTDKPIKVVVIGQSDMEKTAEIARLLRKSDSNNEVVIVPVDDGRVAPSLKSIGKKVAVSGIGLAALTASASQASKSMQEFGRQARKIKGKKLSVLGGGATELSPQLEQRLVPYQRLNFKIGRNDQCPCGSGKKYKRCHGSGE